MGRLRASPHPPLSLPRPRPRSLGGAAQVGDGFVEGKGILENYEGHDMFIVSGSGSGTGISVTGAPLPSLSSPHTNTRAHLLFYSAGKGWPSRL